MAQAFSRNGADVAICDLNLDDAEETARMVAANGRRALARKLDVTDTPRLQSFIDEIVSEFGKIDIWVGNAGMVGGLLAEDEDEGFWRQLLDLNLSAVFLGAQAAGRHMLRQGSGSIINIASMYGTRASAGRVAYCTAKAGVEMLMKTIARDYGRSGVRANTIAPGAVYTPVMEDVKRRNPDGWDQVLRDMSLLERLWAEPEDIAAAAAYLVSDEAAFVTGTVLTVDGGWTAH